MPLELGSTGETVTLNNSTVSSNVTSNVGALGGGIYATSLTLNNSIVLGNHTFSLNDTEISLQGAGVPSFGGNNIVGKSPSEFDTTSFANVQNANPVDVFDSTAQLGFDTDGDGIVDEPIVGVYGGQLSINGGSVATIALKPSGLNPALDASLDSLVASTTDARGFTRSVDLPGAMNNGANQIDLGAFELQSGIPETPSLIVTTNSDIEDDFDLFTTLREAIAFANVTEGSDTITFATGVGQPLENGGTITLTSGQLEITESLSIDASSANGQVVIDANDLSRVLDFSAATGNLDLTNVKVTKGKTVGDNSNSVDNTFSGGGIRFLSNGVLTLTNSEVSHSEVDLAAGGGIFARDGEVVLNNSKVNNNSISKAGGGGDNDLFGGGVFAGVATLG